MDWFQERAMWFIGAGGLATIAMALRKAWSVTKRIPSAQWELMQCQRREEVREAMIAGLMEDLDYYENLLDSLREERRSAPIGQKKTNS